MSPSDLLTVRDQHSQISHVICILQLLKSPGFSCERCSKYSWFFCCHVAFYTCGVTLHFYTLYYTCIIKHQLSEIRIKLLLQVFRPGSSPSSKQIPCLHSFYDKNWKRNLKTFSSNRTNKASTIAWCPGPTLWTASSLDHIHRPLSLKNKCTCAHVSNVPMNPEDVSNSLALLKNCFKKSG